MRASSTHQKIDVVEPVANKETKILLQANGEQPVGYRVGLVVTAHGRFNHVLFLAV